MHNAPRGNRLVSGTLIFREAETKAALLYPKSSIRPSRRQCGGCAAGSGGSASMRHALVLRNGRHPSAVTSSSTRPRAAVVHRAPSDVDHHQLRLHHEHGRAGPASHGSHERTALVGLILLPCIYRVVAVLEGLTFALYVFAIPMLVHDVCTLMWGRLPFVDAIFHRIFQQSGDWVAHDGAAHAARVVETIALSYSPLLLEDYDARFVGSAAAVAAVPTTTPPKGLDCWIAAFNSSDVGYPSTCDSDARRATGTTGVAVCGEGKIVRRRARARRACSRWGADAA